MVDVSILYQYYITNKNEGGSWIDQYKHIMYYCLFCFRHQFKFIYTPISNISDDLENLMNIRPFFLNLRNVVIDGQPIKITNVYHLLSGNQLHVKNIVESEMDEYASEDSIRKLRTMFYKNKRIVRGEDKKVVAIHYQGDTNDSAVSEAKGFIVLPVIVKNTMQKIREQSTEKIVFHIYSEENIPLDEIGWNDIVFHPCEDIGKIFIGLVSADILIVSPSTLSYTAAFLNEGTIYFLENKSPPRKEWKKID